MQKLHCDLCDALIKETEAPLVLAWSISGTIGLYEFKRYESMPTKPARQLDCCESCALRLDQALKVPPRVLPAGYGHGVERKES